MNNKLSYDDKTVKIDSFNSLFNYALSKIDKFTKDDEFFLDALVNSYFDNIKVKNIDPSVLMQELMSTVNSFNKEFKKLSDRLLTIQFLMIKCHEHLSELFLSKLR